MTTTTLPSTSEPVCSSWRAARDYEGQPLIRLSDAWGGLPLGVFPLPADEVRGPSHAPHPMLVMVLAGHGKRWYRHGAHNVELPIAPQHMDLLGRGYERDSARWQATGGLTVGVHFQPDIVMRLAHEQDFYVSTNHEVFDTQLSWLVQALHEEAQRGAPGGRLFSEGLSIALIACVRERYGRGGDSGAKNNSGLRPVQRQRVRDFVEAHLGENLSIARMAQEAALSPERFAQVFKASFGCTPYRWVMQRRVHEATRLLTKTTKPIAEIALDLGFASQSHFTQTYKQMTGTPPGRRRTADVNPLKE